MSRRCAEYYLVPQYNHNHDPCVQAVCATRVVTGGVLAEVAAQVLGPVLLARSADFRGLIAEPKLVMVNNTVTLQDTKRSPI